MVTRYGSQELVWIDMVAPSAEEIRHIMKEFDLDPLVAEELSSPSPKSKVERHGDTLYLVLHFPALRAVHSRPEQEMDFVIGKKFLITTRYENIDPLHHFAKAFEVKAVLGRNSATHGGHLFITLTHNLYRSLMAECDNMHTRLDEVEDRIFAGKEREMVAQISAMGRMIHDFRRTLEPHRSMLESLEPHGERLFGAGFGYHVRAILGEYDRVRNTLEHLRDWLTELRETNNSLLSLKQNEVMKNLTIMAFLTFPLTLLVAIFTVPAEHTPIIGMEHDFWILLGMLLSAATTFILFFKYKKWL
jgi:magnesium transporter